MIPAAALLFLLATLCPAGAVQNAQRPCLLALGDSVASGYGLPDAGRSYPALLADALGGVLDNGGVDGRTSGELLAALESGFYDEALKEADIILVSVGANDLLRPLTLSPADTGVSPPELYTDLLQALFGDGLSPGSVARIARRLSENLAGIITYLRAANPGAVLVCNNLYNPYGGQTLGVFQRELPLGELADACIRELNLAFPASADYILADVYTPMCRDGLTHAALSRGEFDPHPNAAGHSVIAAAVWRSAGLGRWRSGAAGGEAAGFALRRGFLPETPADSQMPLTWGVCLSALADAAGEVFPGGVWRMPPSLAAPRAAAWAQTAGVIQTGGPSFAADTPMSRGQFNRVLAAYMGVDIPGGWPGGQVQTSAPVMAEDLASFLLYLSNLQAREAF